MMMRTMTAVLLSSVVAGCTSKEPDIRYSPTPTDTIEPAPQPAPDRETVSVSHRRELRGLFLTTVINLDFPSDDDLSVEAQRRELIEWLDIAEDLGLNAIFFQVRAESDAFYQSDLEPWSRYLTGTQGQDPGWDPLQTLIEEAHGRALEVHAWINPYRAAVSSGQSRASTHFASTTPSVALPFDGKLWLDPGSSVVQSHVIDVVEDIASRYDIDGLHLDDYFYPYPGSGGEFPDGPSWSAYQNGGGTLDKADWRRANVNALISGLSEVLKDTAPHVRFGISPFGIYKNGVPEGIIGLDQYSVLYADPLKWLDEGWVDYLAPQLYWPTTRPNQPFEDLVQWWGEQLGPGQSLFPALNLMNLGTADEWPLSEYEEEMQLIRARDTLGVRGFIGFRAKAFETPDGEMSVLFRQLQQSPALSPEHALPGDAPSAPDISETLELSTQEDVSAFTVYGLDGDVPELSAILPRNTTNLSLEPGRWAVAAVSRYGVESVGVVVEVPE